MKKSDLKTLHIVVNREGNKYVVIRNCSFDDRLIGKTGWIPLYGLNENMECKAVPRFSIDYVYEFPFVTNTNDISNWYDESLDNLKLIWKRRLARSVVITPETAMNNLRSFYNLELGDDLVIKDSCISCDYSKDLEEWDW